MTNFDQRENRKKQVIAIIGAGISGLLACKYAISKGFDPIVFESESSVGGVWTKTIESTLLQTPKSAYQFTDFPWPDSVTEVFPDQQAVLDYIESYANHFDLLRHIQFKHRVLSLSYGDGDTISGEWNLWGGTGEAFGNKGKWSLDVQDTPTLSTHEILLSLSFEDIYLSQVITINVVATTYRSCWIYCKIFSTDSKENFPQIFTANPITTCRLRKRRKIEGEENKEEREEEEFAVAAIPSGENRRRKEKRKKKIDEDRGIEEEL